MKFTIATGFDRTTQDEVFTTVDINEEGLREILTPVFQRLDYARAKKLLADMAKAGKLVVVE